MTRLIIILSLIALHTFALSANIPRTDSLSYDESDVNVRLPSEEQINKLRSDKNLNYEDRGDYDWNLMKYITGFISDTIKSLKLHRAYPIIKYGFYLLIFVSITFIVYLLFKSQIHAVFLNSGKVSDIELEISDINDVDLEKLLKESVHKNNFRLAIRYMHLFMLKKLDLTKHIVWEKNKTNSDYRNELRRTPFVGDFNLLTTIFEYTWYGKHDPDIVYFKQINNQFNKVFERIDGNEY